MCRQENRLITWLRTVLLHVSGKQVADALRLEDATIGMCIDARGNFTRTLSNTSHNVFSSTSSKTLVPSTTPCSLTPLQTVTHPTGDGEYGCSSRWNHLPSDLDQHALYLVGDLVVTFLLASSGVTIHLVGANEDLPLSEKIDRLVCPWILTIPPVGTAMRGTSACDALVIMFYMESLRSGASLMV